MGQARQRTGTVDAHGVYRVPAVSWPVQLRTRCGPWRAGDGLSPGGPGSLDVLLGVHGAVGSWVVRYACRMASVRREVE